MSDSEQPKKSKTSARTIEEEIEFQEEKLRKLKDQKRLNDIKQRERNIRAVLDLLKTERLDVVSAEQWQKKLPEIRTLLLGKTTGTSPASVKEDPKSTVPQAA